MAATSSPESVSTRLRPDDAIRKHYVELVQSVSTSLLDVTMKLYACGLIASELRDNVVDGTLSGRHAAMQIVNAVQSQIGFDNQKLTRFCDALNEVDMMENVTQKILTSYYGDNEPSGSSTTELMTTQNLPGLGPSWKVQQHLDQTGANKSSGCHSAHMPTKKQVLDVFHRHAPKLNHTVIAVNPLCWDLFMAKIVSDDVLKTVTTPGPEMFSANSELLKGVMRAIKEDPEALERFLVVLERHTSLSEVAMKMREDLQELNTRQLDGEKVLPDSHKNTTKEVVHPSLEVQAVQPITEGVCEDVKDETCSTTNAMNVSSPSAASIPSSSLQEDSSCTELPIKVEVIKGFERVCGRLGGLVHVVMKNVMDEKVCLDDLKDFLVIVYPYMEQELESAKNIRDVFVAVSKQCTLLNYGILIDIADRFELELAADKIDAFTCQGEEYRCKLLDEEFVKELQEMSEQCKIDLHQKVPVKLKVKWSHREATLEKFKQLLVEELPEVTRYLHLTMVDKGCFVFTCCCPLQLEGVVMRLAQEREGRLRRKGVIQVIIGEITVIDILSEEEEEALKLPPVLEIVDDSFAATKDSYDPRISGDDFNVRELLAEEQRNVLKLQEERETLTQQKQTCEAKLAHVQQELGVTQDKLYLQLKISKAKTLQLEQNREYREQLQGELKAKTLKLEQIQAYLRQLQEKLKGKTLEFEQIQVYFKQLREKLKGCEGHGSEIEYLKQWLKDQESMKREMDTMRAQKAELKSEIQRLKDENGALIRVVGKLSRR